MMKKYILALDEGTTSARAILFDKNCNIVSMAQHEIPQKYPHPGWVEQDPMDIYGNQYAALTECVIKSGVSVSEIAAIGITNQRETAIVWNKETGKPICNAIVWQCRRSADICKQLEAQGVGEYVKKTTGLRLDPYFSGTKVKWILDNVSGAKELADQGKLMFGTVDTWLVWKLTGSEVFVTDRTNASRTLMCNIHTGEWDQKMLDILGVPASMLPTIKSSSEIYGYMELMGERIPISGIAGDQQAALFGQCCFETGSAKNTYGTGCFLLANTGHAAISSSNGLLTTIAATAAGEPIEYALEGSVFVGGAVVQWLRDELKVIENSAQSEELASKVSDSGGVYVVPAFAGLGAPHWDMNARGTVVGLTRGSNTNHIIYACLESIAYQTQDVIDAINEDMSAICGDGCLISRLQVDGGASANNLLMQMQADISQIDICVPKNAEATAAGAAYLAGLAVGFYKDRAELCAMAESGREFSPKINVQEQKKKLSAWRRAVRACREFARED
ncbi:MAG: glycerol kinase GlpK [Ruminococcaceae bacterium]|nr:glycerol kinase GlpK [Oscillospiraceae bacterium]